MILKGVDQMIKINKKPKAFTCVLHGAYQSTKSWMKENAHIICSGTKSFKAGRRE